MTMLFSPYSLGPLELSNRITIAPMCQYSAVDGLATDWHMIHLGSLALSGAALITLEATAVVPEGRISPNDLGLWSDAHADALVPILAAMRRHSPIKIGIQLSHAGRKASTNVPWDGGAQIAPDAANGWQTEGPSAVPHTEGDAAPLALDAAGLARVRDSFVAAARRAHALGFDVIELHGAHGYLLHQFLSPLSNRRTDQYGGDLANRMRFPLECFEAVRDAVPAGKPVWMRVSAPDWVEGGWTVEETVELTHALKRRGAAAIHVSTGGLSTEQKIPLSAGYQVPFAERIKAETGLTTIAVGLITEAAHAESILAAGQADAVSLARALLYNPRWPWHAAAELGAKVRAPKQYWRSQPRQYKDLFHETRHGQR